MLHVAQFRKFFFKPTETFLYNYLTAFSRIVPVCLTFQKDNFDLFPFCNPMIELYHWDNISTRIRTFRRTLFRHIMPAYNLLRFDVPKTYKAITEYDVRVLHAHFGYTGAEILPVKRKTGLPMVTTFYGEDISALARIGKWRKAYKELFEEGDLFLVEGPYMLNRLIEIGCPEKKAKVQRIGIYLDKYPFRQRCPKTTGKFVRILFCGSFREKKGLNYALEAVAQAHEQYHDLEFRIIGDGPMRPDVEKIIEKNRMKGYTKLLGMQSHQRMIEEMDNSDIFIHPSVTADNGDSEGGAPTTILEAQACGIPVISTTHADIPNIVVPGESALLSPERDVDRLSENLFILLSKPEGWAKMGQVGHDFVRKYHSITQEISFLEDYYFNLKR